ncbi:MAG: ABC transporter ATP-binding protein [Alphaproteobacteria bacterium]|nr:ABC transporter ATP-binding protein [Alphaproteobacteria bacterium]
MLAYAKPYWFRAVFAVLITIPVGSLDAVIAWSLKPFMDVVLVEKQSDWITYIPLLIIGFTFLQAVFTYIATYMNSWVGNKISLDLKRSLFNKLIHNDASFFDKNDSGFVLYRFNQDAQTACNGLLTSLRLFATRFFSSLSLIIVLFYNSWQLAIIAVVVLLGALMPLARLRKKLKKSIKRDINVMSAILAHLNETFGGNRIITSYNLFDFCRQKFRYIVDQMFSVTLQIARKTGIVAPVMHIISSLGIAFVIWYGSFLIVSHQITVGNFASFVTSLILLYGPIKSIGNNASGIVMSLMAVDRVFQMLNAEPKIKDKPNALTLQNCQGNIFYKNVSFCYDKSKPVLKNINLEIPSGQTIALVGNSGGGKTTLSALLPRFYDVVSGEIDIDGTDIRDFSLESLRDNIGVVFQDNFLFNGTIRENILFGRTDISEEHLRKAIKSACLEDFIAGLEKGLDTQIGERGALLSGGQKQRLAIARAFIKDAPILILDEATSALDNKSEKVVQQAIDNLMKNRTVMVIAHRLSTVRNADCIVVINNGEIVEKGSHEQLMALDGAYAALYKTQLN